MPKMLDSAGLRKWWVRSILSIASSLVGLVLAEGGLRVWLSMHGEPYEKGAQIKKLEESIDTTRAFTPHEAGSKDSGGVPVGRILHPYYGAEDRPDPGDVLKYFSTDPPEENFEVLLVGGSVAMLFGRDVGSDLEHRLASDPRLKDRPVRLLHGAHAAYKQPQQLNKVAYLLSHGYRPDVVINLDGFNEFALALQSSKTGTHPLYPSPPVWGGVLVGKGEGDPALAILKLRITLSKDRSRELLKRAARYKIMGTAIGGLIIQKRLAAQRAERVAWQDELLGSGTAEVDPLLGEAQKQARLQQAEMRGPEYEESELETMKLLLSNWRESSISLLAICEARGVAYIHALQPTLFDTGAKPKVGKEAEIQAADGWVRGAQLGYPAMRTAIPALEAAGVQVLDLSMVFQDVHEPLYYDACHYTKLGSQRLVEPIAEAILSRLE